VHAFEVSVPSFIPVYAGYPATATITIQNTGDKSDWFSISAIGTTGNWVFVKYENDVISSINIGPHESKNLTLFISVPKAVYPGAYQLSLNINGQNETKSNTIIIYVSLKHPVYIDSVQMSCGECEKSIDINYRIRNLYSEDFSGTLKVSVGNMDKSIPVKVNSISSADFSAAFSLENMASGKYSAVASLYDASGALLESNTKEFEVKEISNISFEKKIDDFILFKKVSVFATNYGNHPETASFEVEPVKSIFEIYSGPLMVSGDSKWVIGEAQLQQRESASVEYFIISIQNIIILVVLIIVLIYLYREFFSVKIEKTVIEKVLPSGDKRITVVLSFVSKMRSVDGVLVRDIVPSSLKLAPEFQSVKPVIRKLDEGTELVWRIGTLPAGEERILHYTIEMPQSVIGKVLLPRATFRGKVNEKKVYGFSNHVTVFGTPLSEVKYMQVKVAK
jgi:hypothetical protein